MVGATLASPANEFQLSVPERQPGVIVGALKPDVVAQASRPPAGLPVPRVHNLCRQQLKML
jgi:hypothetical protein